jgi:hypothetical protein
MSVLQIGAVAVLPWIAAAADPVLLWDNGITAESNGHAISPPVWPLIRQADDFVIDDEAWLVTDIVYQVFEDAGWTRGDALETFFYAEGDGDVPGPQSRMFTTDFVEEFTGRQLFGRDEYLYFVNDVPLALGSGRHWLGPRNPDGGGEGTNYWVECLVGNGDCGADADGTFPNADSFDEGQSWQTHGSPYNFQFQLFGFRAIDASPFVFEVTRGERIGGGLLSLADDDDEVLRIAARRPSQVSQPSVEVVIEGFSPIDFKDATAIGFTLDARATAAAIERIDLYNFVEGRYVRLYEETASIGADRTTDVVIRENVSDFITPATSRMRARISYYDPGIPIAGWFGEIDQAIWRVGRPAP